MDSDKPLVGIVMGSDSDWPLVKKACETLDKFGVPYETRVISAHRTPEVALDYSKSAAFVGPALPQATHATGTPDGICTVA